MPSIAQMLATAQGALSVNSKCGGDGARLDAEVLLAHVLRKDRAYLYTWPEQQIPTREQHQYMALVTQRVQGMPIAYLCGQRSFWSLDLAVNHSTLIPRPETELLVETALRLCSATAARVIDLGTGTGAIALALAKERPHWQLTACDKYPGAMALLRRNLQAQGFNNVHCVQSDWFEQIADRDFDLVISNPPYVDEADPHLQQGDVRFEPRTALVSAQQGLADIIHLCEQAQWHLQPGGWLLLEHGYQQGAAVRQLMQQQGYENISTLPDLNQHERITIGSKAHG